MVAVSAPEFRAPGFYQPGSRRGFVGQPLPNVSVRIVDPDSFEPVEAGKPGMLLVKGPNVMCGYLGRADLTETVMRDGWYVTGDIALMDEDGYIKITDRLSRFSKIGGEMVPHGRVEEALQEASGDEAQVFAVTAVPDERKGERLAVLYTLDESRIPEILVSLRNSGLPPLFIPGRNQFIKVEQLPLLGTAESQSAQRCLSDTRWPPSRHDHVICEPDPDKLARSVLTSWPVPTVVFFGLPVLGFRKTARSVLRSTYPDRHGRRHCSAAAPGFGKAEGAEERRR